MNGKTVMILVAGLAMAAPLPSLGQQIYAYPTKGQSPDQQSRDQQECNGWANQQAGYASPPSQGQPVVGGMLRGAAGGAAVGAVGGAIGGNAGKGAAIGAATGALFGGIRQHARNNDQAAYQQQQANDGYRRAYAACMQGRGYSVQ
jgi:hypothetical protein